MEYIVVRKDDSELFHYGIKGMKWGVRRATNQLSNTTTKVGRDKAVASLEKHREKSSAKVAKLQKEHKSLEKYVDKHIQKTDIKVAKKQAEASRIRNKAYGMFTSKKKADKLNYKADKMEARAAALKASSEKAKAKLAKNESLQAAFKKGINDIDIVLVNKGRRYING